jgi:hypothetical protein
LGRKGHRPSAQPFLIAIAAVGGLRVAVDKVDPVTGDADRQNGQNETSGG